MVQHSKGMKMPFESFTPVALVAVERMCIFERLMTTNIQYNKFDTDLTYLFHGGARVMYLGLSAALKRAFLSTNPSF